MTDDQIVKWHSYLRHSGGQNAMHAALCECWEMNLPDEQREVVREFLKRLYERERDLCADNLDAYIKLSHPA